MSADPRHWARTAAICSALAGGCALATTLLLRREEAMSDDGQISCCGIMPSSRGPMLSGVRHRPFPLVEKEVLTESTEQSPGLIRLTFGLPTPEETLGFGQPGTAVKVRPPGSWLRSRPYSVCSSPSRTGSFQLLIKLYPGGRVSGHLNTLQIGQPAWFAKTRTKPVAEGVRKAGLIAFGVGISDCIHTARSLLEGGAERVTLLYCVRYAAEAVLRDEIDELQRSYGDDGRFVVRYYLSRETADANGVAGGLDGAACERLQQGGLEAAFAEWRTIARDCAFLVVGTREMCRQTYAILDSLGFGRRLCGFRGAKKTPFWRRFYMLKHDDRFTKTGSGQPDSKLRKKALGCRDGTHGREGCCCRG